MPGAVTYVRATLKGGGGGGSFAENTAHPGGNGGKTTGGFNVKPGQTLFMYVRLGIKQRLPCMVEQVINHGGDDHCCGVQIVVHI